MIAASTPKMAMTTTNSTRVNPFCALKSESLLRSQLNLPCSVPELATLLAEASVLKAELTIIEPLL